MSFVYEITLTVAGVACGVFALYFAVVTFRAGFWGRQAYDANKSCMPSNNVFKVAAGDFGTYPKDGETRTSHGLAICIKTRKLQPQHRLSREAVDDVIGRRV
ncbi:hypothetical protein [uncultured Roseovarius sp.]|uniref:hypothetical protein n=1 Tax=uncultured Roseovarius sp. TaxID=293344 RepID=UPI0025EDAAA7|nr:hypothetical protein [uncultured Roseovarius sp.]